MQYVYGAMLLHAAGKEIDEKGVTGVLKSAGVDADPAQVKALIASLQGVNIADVLAKAEAAPVAAAPAAAAAAPGDKEAKKEEKKEEKGVSEEEAAAGLSALFG